MTTRSRITRVVLLAVALLAVRLVSQCNRSSARADHAPTSEPDLAPSPAPTTDGPSDSREGCLAHLAKSSATPRRGQGPRLATFNVKWFPDLGPGKKPPQRPGTDVEWLACIIALTGAEAVAVQEFKRIPRARAAAGELLAHLDRMTGGAWDLAFDNCPNEASQHVGILNDQRRANSNSSQRTLAELNPHGEACKDSLRPGLAVDLTLSDGTKVTFVSVHLKSGTEVRSRGLREKSFDALVKLSPAPGHALVVAGDLNSMGCPTCSPSLDALGERSEMQRLAQARGLEVPEVAPPCSHHFERGSTLLDGFVVDPALGVARTEAGGHCATTHCSTAHRELPVEKHVSDHCPVVLELAPPSARPGTALAH